MSSQPEHENSQTETFTPQAVREVIQAELEVSQQACIELSDEQLEEVAGGAFKNVNFGKVKTGAAIAGGLGVLVGVPALALAAGANRWNGVGRPGTSSGK